MTLNFTGGSSMMARYCDGRRSNWSLGRHDVAGKAYAAQGAANVDRIREPVFEHASVVIANNDPGGLG